MKIIIGYITIINMIGMIVMGLDKAKAKAGAWRIPEKTLLGIAVIGGSIGVWIGMNIFRHKTKHAQFKYGVPVIFFLQIAAIVFLIFYI